MPYVDDMKPLWEAAKQSMKDTMSQAAIDLWFGELVLTDFTGNVITFTTESEFKYGFITQKYLPLMAEKFKEQLGFDVEIKLDFIGEPADMERIKNQIRGEATPAESPKQTTPPSPAPMSAPAHTAEDVTVGSTIPVYNFEYTFDNFIVGNSNKFAHAACTAVANHPAENYNPLFIYGPSGLGKTHLMYAITNHLQKKNPNIKIIYIKGEDFTNQMVECLARQAMDEFRNKYRSCNVLLIDDIVRRETFLEVLDTLVHDDFYKEHLRERTQLHKIIERETWIFGDKFDYNLGTSDQGLVNVLKHVLPQQELSAEEIDAIEKEIEKNAKDAASYLKKIPDLYMYKRFSSIQDRQNQYLIVELKAPSVPISSSMHEQAMGVYNGIAGASGVEISPQNKWEYWLVSTDIADNMKKLYQGNPAEQLLYNYQEGNYRVYCRTWRQIIDAARAKLNEQRKGLEIKIKAEQKRNLLESYLQDVAFEPPK